jgi:hypothetical protein
MAVIWTSRLLELLKKIIKHLFNFFSIQADTKTLWKKQKAGEEIFNYSKIRGMF